ncbi:MAG: right-handed parallel beta-helix repeat-containing protein [Anaerolineaceae bacterium]|nr:right-handed parallel beta-helix repeat-containing protein [Anaerolineaceae bacterium]
MQKDYFRKIFGFIIILIFMFSLINPGSVLAEGETPEPTIVEEEMQATELQDTLVLETELSETATEEIEPTDAESDETPTVESIDLTISETEETPALPDKADSTETSELTIEPSSEQLTDIISAAAQADVDFANEEGEPVVMASEESLELMESVPDPWVIRAGITHRFLSDCTGQPIDANNTCTVPTLPLLPVQAAIDFANPGETVYLGPGTFVEDIEITKDLTLQGMAGTIIQSPVDINSEFTTSGPRDNSPIIYVNNATVTIDGITLDGAGNGNANYRFSGIAYHNAGGTVSNSLIQNIMDTPFSGSQHGVAIYAYNEDGTARTLNIFDNTIVDFQKNAMALAGAGLTVDVHDNTITGAGPTSVTAQNGIQVGYDATGSITNNIVEDVWYSGPNWSATGILIYNAGGTVEVSDNTVNDSQNGVYAQNTEVEISDNTINGSDYGVVIYGSTSSSQVSGNTISNSLLGYYSDEISVVVRDNIFTGNTDGAEVDAAPSTGDLLYNYWGCDEGPDGTSSNCNTAVGANYDPWLIDPDGDFVFESSDGTGGYVDNCPTVANPDQADSDGDGIGDACEDGGDVTPTPNPPAPQRFDGVIPVTGGDINKLACPAGINEVVMRLENGNQVRFIGLCDLDAVLNTIGEDGLPETLPANTAYVSDMLIQVLENGNLLELLSNGLLEMSFLLPKEAVNSDLGLYFWDEENLTWIEIPLHSPEMAYPLTLNQDDENDQRLIFNGLSAVISRAMSQENFTGLFVLVEQQ